MGLVLAAGLAGCSLPDVSMSPSLPRAAATTTVAPTPTTAPTIQRDVVARPTTPAPQTPVRPAGDLDTGSLTHQLPAGDRAVVIDYWTSGDARHWGAAGDKTVQLAAHIEGGGTRQTIKATRFLATVDDGTTRSTVAEDRGEFVVTPPFSYTTALGLPASSTTATSLTLTVQFDLLVETQPRSGAFFRQTVLDHLTLPLLQEVSQ